MNEQNPSTEHNVASLMASVASRNPKKLALVFECQGSRDSISFGQLWHDATAVASALQSLGLRSGDRVILMIPMSIDLYVCLLAIIQMGAVVVFVDPWIGAKQIARFSEFAEPSAFIGINKSHLLRWSNRRLRKIRISVTDGFRVGPFLARHSLAKLKRGNVNASVAPVAPDQTALITFTSGSSGLPKGANRTHRFLLSQHLALKQEFPYLPEDIDMPMFPVFALNNLVTGITSVVPEMDFRKVADVDGDRILQQMTEHGITTCTASPPLLDNLATAIENADASILSRFRLRRVLTGGAPVSDDQLRKWRAAYQTPGRPAQIIVAYGSTEAEPVGHISAEDRLQLNSLGKGFCTGPVTELIQKMIIPIHKGAVEPTSARLSEMALPGGEIGELIVAGDHVCRDYYKSEMATAENKISDEQGTVWHRMGDTGFLDSQGRFWLVGRVHSTITRAGKHVHPQLVEQVARSACSDIVQVAAIGYDHAELEEMVVVIVEIASSRMGSAAEIETQLSQTLRESNQPCDRVIVTDSPLPLDPRHNSKIDYARTKELFSKLLRSDTK